MERITLRGLVQQTKPLVVGSSPSNRAPLSRPRVRAPHAQLNTLGGQTSHAMRKRLAAAAFAHTAAYDTAVAAWFAEQTDGAGGEARPGQQAILCGVARPSSNPCAAMLGVGTGLKDTCLARGGRRPRPSRWCARTSPPFRSSTRALRPYPKYA